MGDSEKPAKNRTDYNFPVGWGLYSQQQKSDWFLAWRLARQALRQDTLVARHTQDEIDNLDSDYRVDDELE